MDLDAQPQGAVMLDPAGRQEVVPPPPGPHGLLEVSDPAPFPAPAWWQRHLLPFVAVVALVAVTTDAPGKNLLLWSEVWAGTDRGGDDHAETRPSSWAASVGETPEVGSR
jgi:hypothetical protein